MMLKEYYDKSVIPHLICNNVKVFSKFWDWKKYEKKKSRVFFLTFGMLGRNFSRRHFDFLLRKQVLTFAWNFKSLFSWENNKHIINLSSAKSAQRTVKVNKALENIEASTE